MKKILFSLLFLAVTTHVAQGAVSEPLPFKVDIIAEGIFEQPKDVKNLPAPSTAAGKIGEYSGSPKQIATTRKFKAQQGVVFGFRYRITGLPQNTNLMFEMRAIHPPMAGPDGKPSEFSSAPIEIFAGSGTYDDDLVYMLSDPSEVLPGRWILQLYFDGRHLASREFVLE